MYVHAKHIKAKNSVTKKNTLSRAKNRCTYMHVPTFEKGKEERELLNVIQMLLG